MESQGKEFIPSMDNNLVKSLAMIMQSMISGKPGLKMSQPLDQVQATVSKIFVFAYIWAIGGNLVETIQEKFDTFVRELFNDFVRIPGANTHPVS